MREMLENPWVMNLPEPRYKKTWCDNCGCDLFESRSDEIYMIPGEAECYCKKCIGIVAPKLLKAEWEDIEDD